MKGFSFIGMNDCSIDSKRIFNTSSRSTILVHSFTTGIPSSLEIKVITIGFRTKFSESLLGLWIKWPKSLSSLRIIIESSYLIMTFSDLGRSSLSFSLNNNRLWQLLYWQPEESTSEIISCNIKVDSRKEFIKILSSKLKVQTSFIKF